MPNSQRISSTPNGERTAGRADDRIGGDDEISKKDILRETGISYGQFYRWKRMGLIPESWFRRRSTFTGQESFLPRRKVMERIQRIQELKERYPLEKLAELLSPDAAGRCYEPQELDAMSWVSPLARRLLPGAEDRGQFRFLDLLCLAVIQRLLDAGRLSDDQIRLAASTLSVGWGDLADRREGERMLSVVSKSGATTAVLHVGACMFDPQTAVISSLNLDRIVEDVKIRLRNAEAQMGD